MKKAVKIGVIGAGAAGMTAALVAAEAGAQVILFEAQAQPGKKLAVTGSGRCNISNRHIDPSRYVCADGAFVSSVLDCFGHDDLMQFMEGMAVPVMATSDGWCYPVSQSAANVVAALTTALDINRVEVHVQEPVTDFSPEAGGWRISARACYLIDRLVVASGGVAYPRLGYAGSGYANLGRLGHTIVPPRPALAPLLADMKRLHKLQGVRMDVALRLLQGEKSLGSSCGNVIFTQWGINGPAAMDLSHLFGRQPGDLQLEINFLAHQETLFLNLFERLSGTRWPLRMLLASVLAPKVVRVLLQWSDLDGDLAVRELDAKSRRVLLQHLQSTRIKVTGTRDFHYAQVSTGGVAVTEVEGRSCASRRCPGLYLAGEVLDVVGPCGGYNLQFAFSSGAVAGRAAARM